MVTGNDRREVVQDANQPRATKVDTLPLVGAQTPRAPNLSGIGVREGKIVDALGGFGKAMVGGLSKYVETKRPEWELEGQLQYAEGKTEEEISKNGNRYIKQGYMGMKARTSIQEWTSQMEAQLDSDDNLKQMDSKSFQKMLMEQYKPLAQGIGQDPYTRELMGSLASENLPRLISKQILANNKYNQEQQKSAAEELMNSTATRAMVDPTPENSANLMEMLVPGALGLKREDEVEIQSKALTTAIESGNPVILNALVGQAKNVPTPDRTNSDPQTLKNLVKKHESGAKGYDAVVNNKSGITPTEMTIDQIIKWQEEQKGQNDDSTPVGAYQVKRSTLKGAIAALKIKGDTLFDAATQEKIGTWLMEQRGLNDYLSGKITDDQFIKNISQEWAAIPMDASNNSYYQGVNGNKALIDYDSVKRALTGTATQVNATSAIASMGFPAADIVKINGAITKYNDQKSREFNANRYETENTIAAEARKSGNMEVAYQQILAAKEQNGYNDEWANAQYSNAKAQAKLYQEEQIEIAQVTDALDNNLVGTLSAEKQQVAFDMVRESVKASMPEDATEEDIQTAQRAKVMEVSITNKVVDERLKSEMRTGLLGEVYDKEGKAKPAAMNAYAAFLTLRKQDISLADSYVDEAHKKLLYEAMENDSRDLGTPEALVTAAQTLYRVNEEGYVPPKANMALLDVELDKRIKKLAPAGIAKWLPGASDTDANDRGLFTMNLGMTKEQEKMVRNNTRLKDLVKKDTQSAIRTNPNMSEQAAMNMSLTRHLSQAEIIGGNLILAPPPGRKSIKEAAGIANMKLKDNTINVAVIDILTEELSNGKSRGENAFGDDWNRMQIFEKGSEGKIGKGTAIGATTGAVTGTIIGPIGTVAGAAAGAAVGAGATAIKTLDSGMLTRSIADKFRGYPSGMLVDYNYDSEFITITIPTNKEGTEYLSKTMPISAKELGARVKLLANQETRTQ